MRESIMIRTLRNALVARGIDEFKAVAGHLYRSMPDIVKNAIQKARDQGVLQEWPNGG